MGVFSKLFGSSSEAAVKKIRPLVDKVNSLEPQMQALSDEQMRNKTQEFRDRFAGGESLDDMLCEAFALVREAAVRTVGMRHFDVQLIGGVVLHQGRIAEMKTGEGKTLVATLPAYLNAITGKGVHIVTVNDYLAKRDSEWMGKIYRFLGMTTGLIVHGLDNEERREAYAADITYGTNNEYGFDYLRDNMVVYKSAMVQRELHYAIVDEVDSILVDEARTPLIISGAGDKSTDMYIKADKFVKRLERGPDVKKLSRMEMLEQRYEEEKGDFVVDEKAKTVALTTRGMQKAEAFFNVESLADIANSEINHHIIQALKANSTMKRDKDYVVQDGQVIIVDEFTGRLMWGRRYSDGLHQAIEAKEGVNVEHESKTLATITFQNYFRMFAKLAGMTGTAKTEEEEFQSIYMLDVVEIPTHRDLIREDSNDVVYATLKGKLRAVVKEIAQYHEKGQPVLVGTVSVEKSELLSDMLTMQGIKHEVLNAKHHQKEAEIVAQAGRLNTVTIATNMAGRGTDILLGGNPDFMARQEMRRNDYEDELIEEATSHADTDDEEVIAAREKYSALLAHYKKLCDEEHKKVVALGGLHIIGTERHESRRIDNQLRGRSGRQGDPGSSRFYISLEDDLMRLFGSERIAGLMNRLTPDDAYPMDIGLLSKQIESAQKRVENHNFDIRKHVLQYDDVMNGQREIIYNQRRRVLMDEDVSSFIQDMIEEQIRETVTMYCPPGSFYDDWDVPGLCARIRDICIPSGYKFSAGEIEKLSVEDIAQRLIEAAQADYKRKEDEITSAGVDMREVERVVLLRVVDSKWMDHIDAMDQLKQGIGLRAYGQKDPVVEYRIEGHNMFEEMIANIREDTVGMMYRVSVTAAPKEREQLAKPSEDVRRDPQKQGARTGRNAPCPCGSGKKFKNCCGRE